MTKRFCLTMGQYLLGYGVLAYLIWKYWPGLAQAATKPMHLGPLTLALMFGLAAVSLTLVRWYCLVRAQGLTFSLADAFRLGLIGLFFSTFLPGAISGDVVKAAFIVREQNRRAVAVATVLMDRAMGLWGLTWIVALLGGIAWLGDFAAVSTNANLQYIIAGAAVVVAVSLGLWLPLGLLPSRWAERFNSWLRRFPLLGPTLAEVWHAVWVYRCRGRSVVVALLLTLLSHACFITVFFCAAQIFQESQEADAVPSLPEHFVLVPIGEIVQAFFPAPGGMGGAEWSYGQLYTLVGKMEVTGILAALIYRVINYSWVLAGYFMYLGMRPVLQPMRREDANLVGAGV